MIMATMSEDCGNENAVNYGAFEKHDRWVCHNFVGISFFGLEGKVKNKTLISNATVCSKVYLSHDQVWVAARMVRQERGQQGIHMEIFFALRQ
jgi:hypothetical protein